MTAMIWVLVPIACGCILPMFAIWMGIRNKMNEANTRTQIALAAIEKNPEMDLEELMKKITPKEKLLKEKLLSKLQAGTITMLLGSGFLVLAFIVGYLGGGDPDNIYLFGIAGTVLLAIGVSFLINYHIGKKMLAKEMEAEESKLLEKA